MLVSAAGIVPCGTAANPAPCTLCHLIVGTYNLITWGRNILITVAIVAISIAGIMYIVSSGNEQMITIAKSFLSASLKGFALVLMAWFLVATTMWILSAKNDLGIAKTGANFFSVKTVTFDCKVKNEK